jgi:hypothetical protein
MIEHRWGGHGMNGHRDGWCVSKITLALCLLIFLTGCAPNLDIRRQLVSGTEMAEANLRYENGQYAEAVQIYQALIANGVEDGVVFYNLGNAYFKQGELGRAILNYRRAERLLPRDPDVAVNLQLARSQTLDRFEQRNNGIIGFITEVLVGWSTLDEIAIFALALWIVLCGCAVLALFWRSVCRVMHYVLIGLAIGLVLCGLSLGIRIVDGQKEYGVIVTPNIEVHSGPGIDYLVEFSLHSGAEIRVLEHRGEWSRIALPGNLQGWIPNEGVEEL